MSTPPPPKRQKTFPSEIYTLAWVCALPLEMSAAMAMLDEVHQEERQHNTQDTNAYVLGRIGQHNVAILCLPVAQYGTVKAAEAITHAVRTYPSIELVLMVGIGGGVPSPSNDIRLGDIVVGTRVMAYDLSKVVPNGIVRTGTAHHLQPRAGTLLSALRARHDLETEASFHSILQEHSEKHTQFCHPKLPDQLFHADYRHESSDESLDCDKCDPSRMVPRVIRESEEPKIHYGAIASGNQLIKDGLSRDEYAREWNVICFEMESAGLIDSLPCIPIRGICDYSDTHKKKRWQKYAALTAACFSKDIVDHLPVHKSARNPLQLRDDGDGDDEESTSPAKDALPENVEQFERRRQLLESLRFDQIDTRKISIATAHRKTCQWLLDLPQYQQWLDHQQAHIHHGFLWLRGKPGAGKSTMMKFIYGRMKKKDRRQHILTASFFFHARGEYLEKSISGMYRSLLFQILQEFPDLQCLFDDPDLVDNTQNGWSSLDVLKSLLRAAILGLGQRSLTCYIDALDECDELEIMDMVRFFQDLAQSAVEEHIHLRICFSSRHYPYINIRLGLRLTLEEMGGHSDDLTQYIQSNLWVEDSQLLSELVEQMLEKSAGVFLWVTLVTDILNKEIRRGGFGLRKRLADVPAGLTELFRDLIRRDTNDMEHFRLSILWILCSTRPLTPVEHHHAIWAGLAMKNVADDQPPQSKTDISEDNAQISVVSTSKGLAEVTKVAAKGRATVQFIHQSVRDFLIKDQGLYELWPDLGLDWESAGHELLKSCCSYYLDYQVSLMQIDATDSMQLTREASTSSSSSLETTSLKTPSLKTPPDLPLSGYASHNMLYHANVAAKAHPQQEFLDSLDLEQWVAIYNEHESAKIRRYHTQTTLVYVLADRAHARLLRLWLTANPAFNVLEPIYMRGHRYTHPLFAAIASGHRDSIAALLRSQSTVFYGCDIAGTFGTRTEFDKAGHKQRSPMTWAAEHGLTGFVQWMLERDVSPMASDKGRKSALERARDNNRIEVFELFMGHRVFTTVGESSEMLYYAARYGHYEAVKFILDQPAELVPATENCGAALKRAAENGHLEVTELLLGHLNDVTWASKALVDAASGGHLHIAELLIRHRANVNHETTFGTTALLGAAEKSHVEIVRLLIDNQANVNHYDRIGDTALLHAAKNGHIEIIRLLINNQTNINHQDRYDLTALLYAAEKGHVEIIRLLIDNQANVNHKAINGITALLRAAEKGHVETIRLLINNQANINHQHAYGWTALLYAAHEGHVEIIRLLINNQANINHQDRYGSTALLYAAEEGHVEIIRLLIDNQANVNHKDMNGSTALLRAAEKGHVETIRLLIDNQADVSQEDKTGQTALMHATSRRHKDVIRLLNDYQSQGLVKQP
jgi:ankyrin repeat protein/nucleoside phosphorylase